MRRRLASDSVTVLDMIGCLCRQTSQGYTDALNIRVMSSLANRGTPFIGALSRTNASGRGEMVTRLPCARVHAQAPGHIFGTPLLRSRFPHTLCH